MKKTIPLIIASAICSKNLYPQVTFTGTANNSPKQKVWLTTGLGRKIDSAAINPDTPTFTLKAEIKKESMLFIRMKKNRLILQMNL